MQFAPSPKSLWGDLPPLPLALVLLYVGLASLLLIWFRNWLALQLSIPHAVLLPHLAVQLEDLGPPRIVWTSAAVGILLILYLWVDARRRGRLWRWAHVGAGALLLALHRAVVAALEAIPCYALEQIHP